MEVEEEFLKNAASMARFAEEEIKQFLAWTGRRSPYSCAAEEIRVKLQLVMADIKQLRKEYAPPAPTESYLRPQAATLSRNNAPSLE